MVRNRPVIHCIFAGCPVLSTDGLDVVSMVGLKLLNEPEMQAESQCPSCLARYSALDLRMGLETEMLLLLALPNERSRAFFYIREVSSPHLLGGLSKGR